MYKRQEEGELPITIEHGEQENYLELTFPRSEEHTSELQSREERESMGN